MNAVRYLIAEAQSLGMGSDETARYIRPTVGLTERQAAANLRHYNSVKTQLRADHPRMKEESIERKARTAAAKYAERQQRYRAETIARTEIAQAYNAGADAFIREAMRHDLMPEMKKEWSRASNALRNAALSVLANPSPSPPGSPPGVRSGHLKNNWHMSGGAVCITSGMGYAGYLEHGTRKMAARPFVDKIQQTALPNIMAIFAEIGG